MICDIRNVASVSSVFLDNVQVDLVFLYLKRFLIEAYLNGTSLPALIPL